MDRVYRNGTAGYHVNIYISDPQQISWSSLQRCDNNAVDGIKRLSAIIEDLKAYRLELAQRAAALLEMNSIIQVSLTRSHDYCRKCIIYTLEVDRIYDDGTRENISRARYDGKQRHEALKAFDALKKDYPRAEFVKDIAKKHWEK